MLDLNPFLEIQARLLRAVPSWMQRFLHQHIDWAQPLIVLSGARGTGKTTLLLQHIRSSEPAPGEVLYLSADHIRVEAVGLYPIGEQFFKSGGRLLVVDEVHKSPGWARAVKSLADSFPQARLVVSGSSTIELQAAKADLSRRAVFHHLPAMSLREFMALVANRHHPALDLEHLLDEHADCAARILEAGPVLGLMAEYLQHGAYPFGIEQETTYLHRLRNVIEQVLYQDIPPVTGMRPAGVPALKKILWQLATSPPHQINLDRLASDLGIARQTLYSYLDHLERSGLIRRVLPAGSGTTVTRRRPKLLLENPNLLLAVAARLDPQDATGAVRESFFASQLAGAGHGLRAPRRGDFQVGERVFEVGGRRKTRKQVASAAQAWVVADDLEIGHGHTVPLWLFGFLY